MRTVAEWTAEYTPNENFHGSDLISFSVIDDNGESSEQDGIVSIEISPVNDAPQLFGVNDLVFNEDETISIDLSWEDIDSSDLNISMSDGNNISFVQNDNNFVFSASENWFGSETFTAFVSDGVLIDSKAFTVTVSSINDAPILGSIGDIEFDEDSSYSILINGTDIDGDILNYSISQNDNISTSLNNNTLTFSSSQDFYGVEEFTMTISDGEFDISETFSVIVNSINDAPIITSVSQSEILASDGYEYSLLAEDIDGDILEFNLINQPNNMIINSQTIIWNDIPNDISSVEFVISVSDGIITIYENVSLDIVQFYDCNGIANGTSVEDCAGVCNGSSQLDQCGICNGDNSSCTGCTNIDACNYDSDAILSDNSLCEFSVYLYDCLGNCIEDDDNDGICNLLEVPGCTDELACNYDESATDDNGTCEYAEEFYDCDGNVLLILIV